MMEKLEHSILQKVTVGNHSIHWYKKGKEIIVNSMLFDVHSYEEKKDSTTFTGLFDTKETELKNQVKTLLDQKDQNNDPRQLVIAKWMFQLWVNNDDSKADEILGSDFIRIKRVIRTDNLLFTDISIPFPPPRHSIYA